ncbi:MAG: hypothetical protein HY332_23475 [Chloroflexi bacterium]|nr:hypothetical protein [Chloroflexota bacterium]
MTSVTKECLHRLVDELPEGEAAVAAVRVLTHLRAHGSDPVLRALVSAPSDDEPESDEEREAVAEGMAALVRGEVVPDSDLERELGW